MDIKPLIRTIPDHPKPGIQFRDITTLLLDPDGIRAAVQQLATPFDNHGDPEGRRRRGARLHLRSGRRAAALGGIRADPQARKTALGDRR